MDIIVLNTEDSRIDVATESKLLWSAVVFANRVLSMTPRTFYLDFHNFYPSYSLNERLHIFEIFFKGSEFELSKKQLKEEQANINLIRVPDANNMDQQQLQKKVEKRFSEFFDRLNYELVEEQLKRARLNPLSRITSKEDSSVIWPLHQNAFLKDDPRVAVEVLANSLFAPEEYPMLPGTIEEIAQPVPLVQDSDSPVSLKDKFFGHKLFTILDPRELETNQILITRKDLLPNLNTFASGLDTLSGKLMETVFSDDSAQRIQEEVRTSIFQEASRIQKFIDDSPYVQLLRLRHPEGTSFSLYLGIASFSQIISWYEAFNLIKPEDSAYIKEDLKSDYNLDYCRIFFYLK